MSTQWFIANEGSEPVGPLEESQIKKAIVDGDVPLTSVVCVAGETEWRSLADVSVFATAIPLSYPPPALPSPDSGLFTRGLQGRPGAGAAAKSSWYLRYPGSAAIGPFTEQSLVEAIWGKKINEFAWVCRVGEQTWVRIYDVPRFAGEWPQGGFAPQPSWHQPSEGGFYPAPSAASAGPQGTLLVAVILTAFTALFWAGIVLIQGVIFLSKGSASYALLGLWNLLNVAVCIWVATELWGRKRAGYSRGLRVHIVNAVLGALQVMTAPLLILVVPLHIAAAVLIGLSKDEFPPAEKVKGAVSPQVVAAVLGLTFAVIWIVARYVWSH